MAHDDHDLALFESAAAFARARHAGQRYGDADYFDAHLALVAEDLRPWGFRMMAAGVLHDVLEDTDATADDLRKIGMPEDVIEIVVLVTRGLGEVYWQRIDKIALHPQAALVKYMDNRRNAAAVAALPADHPRRSLASRYNRAAPVLARAAGIPHP